MAMSMGGSKSGPTANINVTPMIDVLLVLIIIFMVITPRTQWGLQAQVPQPPPPNQKQPPPSDRTIVVQVIANSSGRPILKINQDPVNWDCAGTEDQGCLLNRLTAIFAGRAEKVMFVKGDENLNFADVAQVIDIAHAADPALKVGLITAKIEQGG
jgi:biopolymer transport protein TolR